MSDENLVPPWAIPQGEPQMWIHHSRASPEYRRHLKEREKIKAAIRLLSSAYKLTDGSSLWISHRDGRVILTPVLDGSRR